MPQSRRSASRRAPEEKKEAQDVFVEKVLALANWAKANSQTLVLAGVILVVVAAGVVYYASYRSSVADQAIAQLEQVQQTAAFGEPEAAKTALYEYLDRFEGTVYAVEARILLGQLLLEEGEPDPAMEVLAPAVRTMDSDPLGIQAAFLMAAAYEDATRLEESERMDLRIADTADLPFQIREALASAARIRGSTGDWAGAVELYEDLLATLEPTDPERDYWELRLAEASARA